MGGVQRRVLVRCGPPCKPGRGQGPRRHPGSGREHTHHRERVAEQQAQPQESPLPHTARELHRLTEPAGRQASASTATTRLSPGVGRTGSASVKTCLMGGLPEARPSPPGGRPHRPPRQTPNVPHGRQASSPRHTEVDSQPLPPAWPFVSRPQRGSWHLHGDARPQFLHVLGLLDLLLTKREQPHTEGVAGGKHRTRRRAFWEHELPGNARQRCPG